MDTFLLVVAITLATMLLGSWARRRHAEDEWAKSRELNKALAEMVLLERTDGSERAVKATREFCRYHPPDVVIHAALHTKVEVA